jgi:tetrahydromethanopterin S-methyltransferase subunit A
VTAPQRPVPTDKGRAYVAWRDAPDRDHDEDDVPIVAFSAGWDAREQVPVPGDVAVVQQRLREIAATITSGGEVDALLYAADLLDRRTA